MMKFKFALRGIPAVFSILLLMSGGLMLVSGATPAIPEHISWLRRIVPLPFVEISHLISSLVGVFLLFLARGIRLRLDAAYYGCLVLLAVGIVASLLKGFDWHESIILLTMILIMLPTRKYFDRKASILTMSFTPVWIFLISLILLGSAWIGFEAYKHVAYVHELWWKFSYKADAPRFLRALFVSSLVIAAYALNNLFAVARPKAAEKPTTDDLDQARLVAGISHDTIGFLALLGDKSILWSPDRTAFIMYAMTPHYWVAMGDPVGDPAAHMDLVWMFREKADLHGAHAVFYEVSSVNLPLYLDRGFTLLKMGEEANIFLPDFTLSGSKHENQRKVRNRFSKSGFQFRILNADELVQAMPDLRQISDLWLSKKNAHEKGFSLGFFDESYIRHTTVAVVQKDGVIHAFGNFWQLDNRAEITIDLMRYDLSSPPNIMEYLFIESIMWAKENGYQWFGLGMAPFSGMEKHALAPLWHKIGSIIYEHGEDFYNFEGLHAYKSKFNPVWRPRYLATPAGPRIPMVLLSVAGIIAGGLRGILRK